MAAQAKDRVGTIYTLILMGLIVMVFMVGYITGKQK
jgi:hypothetical protein